MSNVTTIKTVKLSTAKEGHISIAHIEQPYGEYSDPVVSIGISLHDAEEPKWVVHVPYGDLGEVIAGLQAALKHCEEIGSCVYHHTDDLGSEVGGGQ